MKLLYTLLLLVNLSMPFIVSGQTTGKPERCPDYKERYDKLKALHTEYYYSESNKKYRQLHKVFLRKLNYQAFDEIPPDILHYIIENVEKTSFGSYEAAEMEWSALKEAEKAAIEETKKISEKTKHII